MNKLFFFKYRFIILGAIIFTLYFWNRFFRSRTSKFLPLNLSILRFFTTLYICIIFLYIIISLLFPRNMNEITEKFIDFIFFPIVEFDKYLKTIAKIKYYYRKFLWLSLPTLEFLIIKTKLFFVLFWALPRLVLLAALYIDVFLFLQFHYKYYVILFGLLLFFNRYIKYSLKVTKKELLEYYGKLIKEIVTDYVPYVHPAELAELEPDYVPPPPDEEDDPDEPNVVMALPFEIFIEFQTKSIVYENISRRIISTWIKEALSEKLWQKLYNEPYRSYWYKKDIPPTYTNKFGTKVPENYYQARNAYREEKQSYINTSIEKMMKISLILEFNSTINTNKRIRNLKILIYLNYLLCWLYVLIISLPSLDVIELMKVINNTWLNITSPF